MVCLALVFAYLSYTLVKIFSFIFFVEVSVCQIKVAFSRTELRSRFFLLSCLSFSG